MMLKFDFIQSIDFFTFKSGNINVLITAPHAYCNPNKIKETKANHLCDFLVDPFLLELEHETSDPYIIKNLCEREIIDMNRMDARMNDSNDSNDCLFRQFIRVILTNLKEKYNNLPILIDLHSYPDYDPDWNEFDMVLLLQTGERTKTNSQLIELTERFFEERGYSVLITDKHNKDDIVEETQEKLLSNSILIEMNELFLQNQIEFRNFVKCFSEFIHFIDERNKNNIFTLKNDSNSNRINIDTKTIPIRLNLIEKEMKTIIKIKDENLKAIYKQYLQKYKDYLNIILTQNPPITSYNNDEISEFNNIVTLLDKLDSFAEQGYADSDIIITAINTISNITDSIIIPIELLILHIRIIYTEINKKYLQEWGLNVDNLIANLISNKSIQKYKIIIPEFSKNINSIFTSYEYDGKYYNIMLNLSKISKIKNEEYENDINLLKDILSEKIITSLKSKDIKKIVKSFS